MAPKKGKAAKAKPTAEQEPAETDANGSVNATLAQSAKSLDEAPLDKPETNNASKPTDSADSDAKLEAQSGAQNGDSVAMKQDNAEPAVEPGTKPQSEPESRPEPDNNPAKDVKSTKRKATEIQAKPRPNGASAEQPEQNDQGQAEEGSTTKKRKMGSSSKEIHEGSRKSGRRAARAQPTQEQILEYLLSDAAADLCRPDDETKAIQEGGPGTKTYSASLLSPFEELLCAVVLSRPISHRLGMRTIRTILSDPYGFNDPQKVIDAGKKQVRQALEDAKTQHKDKTAEQISLIAEVVTSQFSGNAADSSLEKLRKAGNKDWDSERDLLQQNIKGLGKTGLDIFCRRIQWIFEELFPFMDEKSCRGTEKLGLPKRPDDLLRLLREHWKTLDTSTLSGDNDAAKQRHAFVIICERATGSDLEGNTEQLIEAAASV